MRRKVVKQGTATLMVSLPAAWARRNEIEKGTEVELQEFKDSLRIAAAHDTTRSRIEIDTVGLGGKLLEAYEQVEEEKGSYRDPKTYKQFKRSMLRLLTAMYKSGYDEVKISYDHPGTINLIQQALGQEISEYEIVEQTKTYCLLQDISGVLKERFDPAVNRIFYLLMQMAEESEPIFASGEYYNLAPLRFLEESNNRFTTVCRRILSKKGYKDTDKTHFMYHILEELERIADQYKYMYDYLIGSKQKLGKKTLKLYSDLNKILREYWELYSQYDKEKIFKIGVHRKKLVANAIKELETSKGADTIVLHHVLTIGQILFELVEPTISLRLEK